MVKASKDTRIKKETKRLMKIFADMDSNKLAAVKALIDRLAFIPVNLQGIHQRGQPGRREKERQG